MSLNEKVVWITGSSSGIGKALAEHLSALGAKLILSARNETEIRAMADQLPNAVALPLDLNNAAALKQATKDAIALFGTVDVLINNAGISQRSKCTDTEARVYRDIMEVNYFGAAELTRQLLPHFIEKNAGQFVAISSVAGITGLPYRTAYCAAKHALEGFYASLRTELWQTGINILIVRPGAVRTNIARHALTGNGTQFNGFDKIIDKGMHPSSAAAKIIDAISQRKKVLMIGSFKERSLFVLNRFFPSIVFNAVKKLTH